MHAFVTTKQPQVWIDAVAAYADATCGRLRRIDAGHYLHVERPGAVAEASRALIKDDRVG